MTKKYESVLSEAELAELCGVEVGNPNYLVITSIAKHVQQATLDKLQPQLDAIGAGGVSGQRFIRPHTPEGYKLVPIVPTMEMVQAGDSKAIKTAWLIGSADVVPAIYHAMLAAAPTPDIKDSLTTENQELRIVFSGEMPNLTFIEVEDEDGFSVNAGQWHKRFDGYTELRIKAAKE